MQICVMNITRIKHKLTRFQKSMQEGSCVCHIFVYQERECHITQLIFYELKCLQIQ